MNSKLFWGYTKEQAQFKAWEWCSDHAYESISKPHLEWADSEQMWCVEVYYI